MWKLELEPRAPVRVPVGLTETVRLRGKSPLPEPPFRGRIRVTKPLTGEKWLLKSGQTLPTEHCGGLRLEVVKGRAFDYLGLLGIRVRKTVNRMVLVVPYPKKLEIPPDLERYLARAWRPKFGGGYAENHELRLYRPGDSLNQVHWKLSAKTGELILREPMEPERGLLLVTLDVCGTAEELDRKFGRLLWLGQYLLEQSLRFEVRALTKNGIESRTVTEERELRKCVEELLCAEPAPEGSMQDRELVAFWHYHIGGGADEA